MDFANMVTYWQNAQVVCFDVNNTVCEKDGIDEVVVVWTVRFARLSHSM